MMGGEIRLRKIFDLLLAAFGARNWWPGDTPLEVMVGAVLTQNTSWKNVEKAIASMKSHGVIDMFRLHEMEEGELAAVIHSAGFHNIKARKLKNLVRFVHDPFDGSIEHMGEHDLETLRPLLLGVNGLGPETVDSILLYALGKPVFVVDAYTKRFLAHHGLYEKSRDYHEIQKYFHEILPAGTSLYNEFHALIVALCQRHCRKQPLCEGCPLEDEGRNEERTYVEKARG
jgi:endonuclease III related protein